VATVAVLAPKTGGVQCSKVQSIRGLLGCPSIDAHLDPHCQKVRGSGRHEPEPPQDCRHFYRPNPMKHTKKWGSVHIWTSHCQKVRGSGRHKPGPPVPTGSPPALGPIPNVPCAEGTLVLCSSLHLVTNNVMLIEAICYLYYGCYCLLIHNGWSHIMRSLPFLCPVAPANL